MTGYLDRIRPEERERLVEIDRATRAITRRRENLIRRRKSLTEDEHWELFAITASRRELFDERRKLVVRVSCRVTYRRLGARYWRENRERRAQERTLELACAA